MAIQKLSTALGAGSAIPTAGRFAQISGGTYTTYVDGGITYGVHTFTADGTLTVQSSGVVDLLVLGGGGGGGANIGGGGGAGGHSLTSNSYLSAGTHTVTIGAGGTTDISGNASSLSSYYGGGGGAGGTGQSSG